MQIIFEAHATSIDNEAGLASGWNDVPLSKRGEQQAIELGNRYKEQEFETIFCSDLQRSYMTAQLAFGTRIPIIQDARLRECNYGKLTQADKGVVGTEKALCITDPFPEGESYEQACARVAEFLKDIRVAYAGKRIMIIGHRATQYGIEHLVLGKPLLQVVTQPWSWQSGWNYNWR